MKKLAGNFRGYVNCFNDQIFIIGHFESLPLLNMIKVEWDTPAQTFNSGYLKRIDSTWHFGSLIAGQFVSNDSGFSDQVMSIVISAFDKLRLECALAEKKNSGSAKPPHSP